MPLLFGSSFDEEDKQMFGIDPPALRHEPEDEEIVELADPGNKNNNNNDASVTSVFGEISLFRDFFMAAFSDGYQNSPCCGEDGMLRDCCTPGGSRRVAPDCKGDVRSLSSQNSYGSTAQGTTAAAAAAAGARTINTYEQQQQHHVGGGGVGVVGVGGQRQRRKKPLAVAVGYKYAEDMNGRPVVITRRSSGSGTRRSPIDLTTKPSRSRSGASSAATATGHGGRTTNNNNLPPLGSRSFVRDSQSEIVRPRTIYDPPY